MLEGLMTKVVKMFLTIFFLTSSFINATENPINYLQEKINIFSPLENKEHKLLVLISQLVLTPKQTVTFQKEFNQLISLIGKHDNDTDKSATRKALTTYKTLLWRVVENKLEEQNGSALFTRLTKEQRDEIYRAVKTFLYEALTEKNVSSSQERALEVIELLGEKSDTLEASVVKDFYTLLHNEYTHYEEIIRKQTEKKALSLATTAKDYALSFLPIPMSNLLETIRRCNITDYEKLLDMAGIESTIDEYGTFQIVSVGRCLKNLMKIVAGKDYLINPLREHDPKASPFIETDDQELKDFKIILESILSLSHIIDHAQRSERFQEIPLFDFYETQIRTFVLDPEEQEQYLASINVIKAVIASEKKVAMTDAEPLAQAPHTTETKELVEQIATTIRSINPWILHTAKVVLFLRGITCKLTGKPHLVFYRKAADAAADMQKTSQFVKLIGKASNNQLIRKSAKAVTTFALEAAKDALYLKNGLQKVIENSKEKLEEVVYDSLDSVERLVKSFPTKKKEKRELLEKAMSESLKEILTILAAKKEKVSR